MIINGVTDRPPTLSPDSAGQRILEMSVVEHLQFAAFFSGSSTGSLTADNERVQKAQTHLLWALVKQRR